MRQNIHPKYKKVTVTCTSCGATFETGSTIGGDIRVDTCSNCHPFYTGRQRFAAAAGRIERFNKKYGLDKK
ncbi:MAG: 50S ribosomal protein L31 [Erysipelotrichaceae bacterium]|nr:50S ribosomal protein L31 [Erysipelotrichaceae bacterium]